MLTVALTGGIATGKSTVLRWFATQGIPTVDADRLARDVVQPGTPAWHAIAARFGPSIVTADRTLDRAALATLVFDDDAARRDLEAIVHPRVYAAVQQWRVRLQTEGTAAIAMADIPLLFETGHADDFDRVVLTTCALETQIARLAARDGLDAHTARRRIDTQWPSEAKAKRAHYVIDTGGTVAATLGQAADVLARLRVDASA